ncbi:MAG TPA: DUF418 domain-containing protein [Puia sp.]|nr:DUF418 domain-containing protein [Puia sp.]
MNAHSSAAITPVTQSERIAIIDSLRGIALCGILLMNIPYFGLPDPAADNLTVMHELGTINQKLWYFIEWTVEGTQRAIFSLLFGAGVILFVTRLQKRMEGIAPAEYFIRRQLWLLVFGLFNAFVLMWTGDILFEYAIAGIIVFVFRKLKPKYLIVAAGVCLVLMTVRENKDFYAQKRIIHRGELVAKIDTTKVQLNDEQKSQLQEMTSLKEKSDSTSLRKEMEKNLRDVRGGYFSAYENLSAVSTYFEIFLGYYNIWDILLFMFLGMCFFKTGVLTGEAPVRIYWILFIVGSVLGLLISYSRLESQLKYHFNSYEYAKNISFQYYEISRTVRSLGVFGLIMLVYKSGWFQWLFKLMQPVGQMAFTNYLMQSFLGGLFFYGVGFGMYGRLQRYEIYYVVLAVWILEIIWSHIWLRYFRYGPLEWLWRSLTYWKRQPLKR